MKHTLSVLIFAGSNFRENKISRESIHEISEKNCEIRKILFPRKNGIRKNSQKFAKYNSCGIKKKLSSAKILYVIIELEKNQHEKYKQI